MDKAAVQSSPIKIAETVAGPSTTEGFLKSPISQNIPPSNQAAEVTNVIENLASAPIPNTTEVAGATNTTENLEAAPRSSIEKVTKQTSLKKSTAIDVSMKRTRNVKSNIQNKKLKTANAGATMVNLVSAPESKNPKIQAAPKSSIKKVTKRTSLKKSIASDVSMKRTKDAKSNIQNKKLKTANVGATKVNLVSAPKSKNLKRNKASHPKTSEMVMDAIKSLKKRNGATFEDISKHMDENQQVSMKVFKPHVKKFLMKSVENGSLEKLSGADAVEKYKIKKPENVGEKKVAKLI